MAPNFQHFIYLWEKNFQIIKEQLLFVFKIKILLYLPVKILGFPNSNSDEKVDEEVNKEVDRKK